MAAATAANGLTQGLERRGQRQGSSERGACCMGVSMDPRLNVCEPIYMDLIPHPGPNLNVRFGHL